MNETLMPPFDNMNDKRAHCTIPAERRLTKRIYVERLKLVNTRPFDSTALNTTILDLLHKYVYASIVNDIIAGIDNNRNPTLYVCPVIIDNPKYSGPAIAPTWSRASCIPNALPLP